MTARSLITDPAQHVNRELADFLQKSISRLFTDEAPKGRRLEQAVWNVVLEIGRMILSTALAWACWRVTKRETQERPVRLRLDVDYTLAQSTTLGTVHVPLFAWREGKKTLVPARAEVFPLHPKARSSELLIEWETRLGCQLPFRQAEEGMAFFSHGAVHVEDTTIARHMRLLGPLLDEEWTCRAPTDSEKILRTKATCDRSSNRPLLYVSTDAHALRRYVDDTWKSEFKMLNGIRFWCIDRNSGQTIHLGGEYTWGDCREVAQRVKALAARLIPTGDDAPQVVCIADGMPWIREHVHPVLPSNTCFILDFYHLAERLSKYANAAFGANTRAARRWVRKVVTNLTGKRPYKKKTLKNRKGHKKKSRAKTDPFRTVHPCSHPHGPGEQLVWKLIDEETDSKALDKLSRYVADNLDRIDYSTYRVLAQRERDRWSEKYRTARPRGGRLFGGGSVAVRLTLREPFGVWQHASRAQQPAWRFARPVPAAGRH